MGYSGQWKRTMGLGREATYGAGGTVSEWVNFTDAKFDMGIPLEKLEEMIGAREQKKTYVKSRTLAPSFSFDLEPENGLGVVFRSLFGTVSSAQAQGTFAYKHIFSFRQDAEVDSLWASLAQVGTSTKNYVGLFPSKLSVKFGKDENVQCEVAMIGQNEATGTYNSGTYGTLQPFTSFANMSVKLDGTENVDIFNFELNVDTGAKAHLNIGTLNSIRIITQGKVAVDGSFEIYFADETERTKFLNKISTRIDLALLGPAINGTCRNEVNFRLPAVEYSAVPFEDKDGVAGATIAFNAKYGSNATGTGVILAELINTKLTY